MQRTRILLVVLFASTCPAASDRDAARGGDSERESARSAAVRELTGRVLDFAGPVENATVGLKAESERVRTDAGGRFSLRAERKAAGRLTASKQGYYISGTEVSGGGPYEIRLRSHPQEDCTNYRWIDPRPDPGRPEQCGNCHPRIYDEWSQSPHATSAVNRRFMNLYEGTDWQGNRGVGWSLLDEYPEGAAVCSACHAPSLEADSPGFSDLRQVGGVGSQGVHCDFCHKIADVSDRNVGRDHGRFAIELLRPPPGRELFFGPLDDDDRGNSACLPLYGQSRYCASCHEGVLFGVHAYSEYSEWLASEYAHKGVQCQDCHMAPTGTTENFAEGHGGIRRDPNTLSSHGSSRGRADVLRRHLSLDVSGEETSRGYRLVVEVKVEGVGHRTPTGYPSRALILWIDAATSDGREVKLLEGPRLPGLAGEGPAAEGNLAGRPGRMYAKIFEDFEGRQPVPYWSAVRLDRDNRLMPDETDRVRFLFERPEAGFQAEVRLIYRRFSKYLADQKGWPDNEFVVAECRWSPAEAEAADEAASSRAAREVIREHREEEKAP